MKIALLTKYSRLGASSRLRTMQYMPYLQEAGIDVQVLPLFDDVYLQSLYTGKRRSGLAIFGYYFKRAWSLHKMKNIDLVWMEKEVFPYIPYWFERFQMPSRIPYVVDYDDAIFHNYDMSAKAIVRKTLGKKIDKVMSDAAVVIAGNDYLASRAKKAGARNVELIPTVVDVDRYQNVKNEHQNIPVVGWVGSPSTQKYIENIIPVLRQACEGGAFRIVMVGASKRIISTLCDTQFEVVPWTEENEAEEIAGFDIGVMPLFEGPWEQGKCGYKLIQYMASGLPVVASPVGVNNDIVDHGINGFLAGTEKEWIAALVALRNPELRRQMGAEGRRKVMAQYSLHKTAPKLINLFNKVNHQVVGQSN